MSYDVAAGTGDARPARAAEPQAEIVGTLGESIRSVVAKLTNEILLFVIALMIVITLMALLAPDYAQISMPLVAFLSTLGVGAYLWTWRGSDGRTAKAIEEAKQRVAVTIDRIGDDAIVTGVQSSSAAGAGGGDTELILGDVSGRARVAGRIVGADDTSDPIRLSNDEFFMIKTYRKLNEAQRKQARRQIEDWSDRTAAQG